MDHHRCRVSRERHHCLPIRPSQNGSHFQSTEFKNKSGNKHAFKEKSTKFGQLCQKLNYPGYFVKIRLQIRANVQLPQKG
jgi:hypothetical protein